MNNQKLFFALLVLGCLSVRPGFGQISSGGHPISFTSFFTENYTQPETVILPFLDMKKVEEEDRKNPGKSLFARPLSVDFNLGNAGQWIALPDGSRVWRLKFRSQGALGLAVMYDQFWLPEGATLFMYNEDKTQVLGAYTHRNNKDSKKFITGFVYGETAIIEYHEPVDVLGQGQLHIHRVDHAYDAIAFRPPVTSEFNVYGGGGFGFGTSLPCNLNVNCPLGDEWQNHKRGVVRIMVVLEEGSGWCSGSLINNANNDGTPYVLTAFHCQDGFTPLFDMWRFDFNYETQDCTDPLVEPEFQSIVGGVLRAGREESDFLLVEITSNIPSSYNPYFPGWNNEMVSEPDTTVVIHHASGDIKKISRDIDPALIFGNSINWNTGTITPPDHHFRVILDEGTFQLGSSGSPLFDSNGAIVGQLHGGFSDCSQAIVYFGRLAMSWNEGTTSAARLKDWLDPGNTGIITLPDFEPATSTLSINGSLTTRQGTGIAFADVMLSGDATSSQTTTADGMYAFEVVDGGNYTITPVRNTAHGQGVSTFDMVLTQSHILGITPLSSPYQIIAADVNNSGSITTFDMVNMRQMILGIITEFPNNTSWRFIPADHQFTDPDNPFLMPVPESMTNSGNTDFYDFIGVKVGDVNESVDPASL